MTSADWKLDPEELASLFNEKTKAIIYNNPNNPLGKIYSRPEIQTIADLCIKHNVLCISGTLVFQLEEVCGINVVVHKMKNISGGI